MRRIYLVRHCQPDFPGGETMCIGSTDLPLSAEGHAQAQALSLPPVAALFSSPLTRCIQTARALNRPFAVLDGFREMDAGQWDGLTFSQIRERYPQLYAARGLDRSLPIPGSEDRAHALRRFRTALEEAARQTPGDFAVITHGGIIALFLESVTGQPRKPGYGEMVTVDME